MLGEKEREYICQDRRYPGRESNPINLEYKTGILRIQLRNLILLKRQFMQCYLFVINNNFIVKILVPLRLAMF
jgi:hypothetical protein